MALIPAVSGTGLGFLPMLLFGLCGGAMHNVQMAIAGEAVAAADRALAMALVGSVGNVAMTLTPLLHGWMADRGMLAEAFPWTGLVLAIVAIAAWRWSAALRPRTAQVAEVPEELPRA
jgi:MFS family permease